MTKRPGRRVLTAALLLAAAAVPASASASSLLGSLTTPVALLSGKAAPCTNRALSQPFAAWGDRASYFPVDGGNFETGAAGWTLTGGAKLVSGGDPFVAGSAGVSLDLPAGSTATAPATCVDLSAPTLRAFAGGSGSVAVSAVVGGTPFPLGTISSTGKWAPTAAFINLSSLLSILSTTGTVTTVFRFSSTSGDVHVDDVYVDPYRRT
ncbi:MAG: hypothetical protein ABI317_13255 [Gaiellales bacterium]